MKHHGASARRETLMHHNALWLALSHFLSADLVEELARVTVECASASQLSLDDLCIMSRSEGPPHLSNWTLRLRERAEGLGGFLQDVVRALAWQSDVDLSTRIEGDTDEAERMREIDQALSLGASDLETFDRSIIPDAATTSLQPLIRSMRAIAEDRSEGDWTSVVTTETADVPPPLNALLIKHLGDLCADADRLGCALHLYGRATELSKDEGEKCWESLRTAIHSMASQSQAAMHRLTEGPASAAAFLQIIHPPESLHDVPLLALNAGVDSMNADIRASQSFWSEDVRAAALVAPQLELTQRLDIALENWTEGKFREAHRRFWAALRRRRALGSLASTEEAMAFYSRSIFDELFQSLGAYRRPQDFELAVRLLISSGRTDAVREEASREKLVQAYVNSQVVEQSIKVASRHEGARDDRYRVLIHLAEAWVGALSVEQESLARELLEFLVRAAKEEHWSVFTSRDVARPAFKALANIAQTRPEFRGLVSSPIADAFIDRIVKKEFHPLTSALDTINAYAPALRQDDLERCVEAALDLLSGIEPNEGSWPIMTPAIELISRRAARNLWPDNPEIARRSAQTLIRFGLEAIAETPRMLALIDELAPYLDQPISEDGRFASVIEKLRERSQQIQNSAVTLNIVALLRAPKLAGREGVEDALRGLFAVIGSAETRNPSISLTYAYDAVLQLAYSLDSIVRDLGLGTDEKDDLTRRALTALERFWKSAARNPSIFIPFSIPPKTEPSPVIIHNWAFASLAFGRAADALPEVSDWLEEASRNTVLEDSIRLAKAVRLSAGDPHALAQAPILEENKEAFYAALGSRLALLAASPDLDREQIVRTLTSQCLRYGPNGLDSAVFIQVLDLRLEDVASDVSLERYADRLARNSELQRALHPLLDAIRSLKR